MISDELYSRIYAEKDDYNCFADWKIEIIRNWLKQNNFKKIVDIGCGSGNYIKELKEFPITGVEPSSFIANKDKNIIHADIMSLKGKWDAFYCMDVLEHIPPEEVEQNVDKLTKIAKHGIVGVANHPDSWEGVELHLVQEPLEWWQELLSKYFKKVEVLESTDTFYTFKVDNE